VSEHKMSSSYGPAKIIVSQILYSWLNTFVLEY